MILEANGITKLAHKMYYLIFNNALLLIMTQI